ncbi:XRE family transcriptional regulator [Flavobacterium cupreum]|uniref:XRE family transcriptional regulator n=1 Tax=Flavobacterium cupreum TaxID=2133766 RepID=A0A434A7F0_9FLAO|nr:helix-turn-helix transcriptional regulator [Flavobacterium cupreum]RUT70262.1 XRE family transcriptional regulator [Flavobacterium cupreum]
MARYKNETALKTLGLRIKAYRIKAKLEILDLVVMTGFSYNTISDIENGSETTISYFIGVCFALGIHPKEMMDIEFDVKSKNPLTPDRLEKSRLTQRIRDLIQSGYFNDPRSTNEVTKNLKEIHKLDFESKNVSVILTRFATTNILNVTMKGNRKIYINKSVKTY